MHAFAKRKLLDDVSDVFQQNNLSGPMKPFIPAVSDDGKQYTLPTQYSAWGVLQQGHVREDRCHPAQNLG
jgi:multiple sugar transport system substrate-binding protein